MHRKIRALIADDSALMRREIRKILEVDDAIEVVAVVRNGKEAVEKVAELKPDVVTLDINMPEMDGLTALQLIMMQNPTPVIMLSSLTQEGAVTTYEALELGAVDFVGKPGGTVSLDVEKVGAELREKIKSAAQSSMASVKSSRSRLKKTVADPQSQSLASRSSSGKASQIKAVVVGQSTGGPNTFIEIIRAIPEWFPVPLLVVQHMPAHFTPSFAQRISKLAKIPFKQAEPGDEILGGHGYLAAGGQHLVLSKAASAPGKAYARLSKIPADSLHIPSVDVTMTSVLEHYGSGTLGVLLTGMGADGSDSMVQIRKAGGRTIAESEETAIVFGMPKEAIRKGGAEFVLPAYEIGQKIVELVGKGSEP